MKIKHSIFALACGLTLTAGQASHAESSLNNERISDYSSHITIANARYIAGGVTSIMPGLGVGHAVQGRYMEKGWIFTLGQLGFLWGLWYFFVSGLDDDSGDTKKAMSIGERMTMTAFMFGLVGMKIWEMADAWIPSLYKKVSESPVELSPLYAVNKRGRDHFGLSLKYKF